MANHEPAVDYPDPARRSKPRLFRGAYVWSGILMALAGFLAEEWTGGEHAFEFFLFFGGLSLGRGVEINRAEFLQRQEAECLSSTSNS